MTGAQLLDMLMRRIAAIDNSSGLSFIDALNSSVEVAFLRLWAKRSEIVQESFDIYADDEPFALPDNFRGFADGPYLVRDSSTIVLEPLPPGSLAEVASYTGTPRYYSLLGANVEIYPPALYSDELKGRFYASPGTLGMESTLPWGGVFDWLIADGVIEATKNGGTTALLANQAFLITMDASIDAILSARNNPARRRVKAQWF